MLCPFSVADTSALEGSADDGLADGATEAGRNDNEGFRVVETCDRPDAFASLLALDPPLRLV